MRISRVEFADRMAGIKYRPSNGTEGAAFFAAHCQACARDLSMNGTKDEDDCGPEDICPIIAASMAFDIDATEYPVQWQYDQHGLPTCTAFVPKGEPIPTPRCTQTLDMFQEQPAR